MVRRRHLIDLRKRETAITGEMEHLIDAIAQGLAPVSSVKDRILALEAERIAIAADVAQADASAEIVALHPRLKERYAARIADLAAGLAGSADERHGAASVLREFVDHIEIGPGSPATITAYGLLPRVLQFATAREKRSGNLMVVTAASSQRRLFKPSPTAPTHLSFRPDCAV